MLQTLLVTVGQEFSTLALLAQLSTGLGQQNPCTKGFLLL